jgi:hypothetical protein
VVAIIILFFVIRDMSSPKADYQIGMITSQYYPQQVVELLEKSIEPYAEDLNGDGRVIVQINPYSIISEDNDPQLRLANQVKLDADLSSGISMLFITDEESFQTQQKRNAMFANIDGSTPQADNIDQSKMRIPLLKLKAFSELSYEKTDGTNLLDELGLSLRVYEGSAVEGQEDDYWNACRRLFQKLADG